MGVGGGDEWEGVFFGNLFCFVVEVYVFCVGVRVFDSVKKIDVFFEVEF